MNIKLLSKQEYLFFERIQIDERVVYLYSDHSCYLTITVEEKGTEKLIKREKLIAPLSYCYYDKHDQYLYLGQLYGDVIVFSLELECIAQFRVEKDASLQSEIILLDTNKEYVRVGTKLRLYTYKKQSHELIRQEDWEVYLVAACRLPSNIHNQQVVALGFKGIDHPILVYPYGYVCLFQRIDKYIGSPENSKQKQEGQQIQSIKLSRKNVITLAKQQKDSRHIHTVNIYGVRGAEEESGVVIVSRRDLIMQVSVPFGVLDLVVGQRKIHMLSNNGFWILNISLKMREEESEYRKSKEEQFKEITEKSWQQMKNPMKNSVVVLEQNIY